MAHGVDSIPGLEVGRPWDLSGAKVPPRPAAVPDLGTGRLGLLPLAPPPHGAAAHSTDGCATYLGRKARQVGRAR